MRGMANAFDAFGSARVELCSAPGGAMPHSAAMPVALAATSHGGETMNQWMTVRENLQESPIFNDFHGKIHGFL